METLKDKAIDMKGIEDTLDKVYTEKDLKQAIKELKDEIILVSGKEGCGMNNMCMKIDKIFGDFEEEAKK